jgi:hypothetical protein
MVLDDLILLDRWGRANVPAADDDEAFPFSP